MRHLRVALVALLTLAPATVRADDEQVLRVTLAGEDAAGEPLVTVECINAPLDAALRALSRAARRTAISKPWPTPVTLTLGPTPWREAAAQLAAYDGASVTSFGPRALRIVPTPPLLANDFGVSDVGETLKDIASTCGHDLVVGAGVGGQLTMSMREAASLDVIHAIARACDARVQRQGDLLLIGRSLPSPMDPPAPAGRPEGLFGPRVLAVAAPAGTLLRAMASAVDVPLVIDQAALLDEMRVTLEWPSNRAAEGLEELAKLRGWRIEQLGTVYVIRGGTAAPPVEGAAPVDLDARRRVTIPLPGREPLALALQAVLRDDPPVALLSGQVYEQDETIRDPATGEPIEGLILDAVGKRDAELLHRPTGVRVRLLLD